MNDIRQHDATALRTELLAGTISPPEALGRTIEQFNAWNPTINAIIHPRLDQALYEAAQVDLDQGALAGVPIAIKDLGCEQAGEPFHCGTSFLRNLNWKSTYNSYLWSALAAAGAISIGRTNTPEFGSTITTEPTAYGATRNPHEIRYSAGGSSGGSAAAVAAGIVPIAHGNDGGGSLRIPASACGLIGLKPSRGTVSAGPTRSEHRHGLGIDGVLTKTVRDTALALDVISGSRYGDYVTTELPVASYSKLLATDPGPQKIAIATFSAHPACVDAVNKTASLLEGLGHQITAGKNPPEWFSNDVTDQIIVLRTIGMAQELYQWGEEIGRPITQEDIEPSNWWSSELGKTLPGTMYLAAQNWLHHWSRRTSSFWNDFDLLLTPVLGGLTPTIGFLSDPKTGQQQLRELIGFVDQANVTGQPAISVPVGEHEGLPIGVQVIAARGQDTLLLQIAQQLEDSEAFTKLSNQL